MVELPTGDVEEPTELPPLLQAMAAATPDRPVAFGRYTIEGLISRGGMGTVFEAVDREHGSRVALKTLTHLSPGRLLRFKQEFRAVADLRHRNLVPLYELGCEQEVWFFTMELVHGEEFLEAIRGPRPDAGPASSVEITQGSADADATVPMDVLGGIIGDELEVTLPLGATVAELATPPPSLPRLRECFRQLAEGLGALHRAGYVHLDIKPGNVLVDGEGRVVILDFGLARRLEASDQVEPHELEGGAEGAEHTARLRAADEAITVVGTPAWMSPEQHEGLPGGPEADWYAVGLMLYEALTGQRAFRVEDPAALAYAKRHIEPTAPHELLPAVGVELSATCRLLLRPDPADRPDDERALALLGGDATATDPGVFGRPFVAREEELARLDRCWAGLADGRSALVEVRGSSGLGKSALLRAFAERVLRGAARSGGAAEPVVLRGRCYERESVPNKAFDGVVDDLAARLRSGLPVELPRFVGELARQFPVLATVPAVAERDDRLVDAAAPERRRQGAQALRDLLERLAAEAPLLLQIDDLQWTDEESLELLTSLLEPPPAAPMLIVVGYRPDHDALEHLTPYVSLRDRLEASGVVHVEGLDLRPLGSEASRELAVAWLDELGHHDPELAASVAQESGGVPFLVEALASHALVRPEEDGDAEQDGAPGVDDVVRAILDDLQPKERGLLEVLALASRPIPQSVAFAVADLGRSALPILWSLRKAHLLRTTGASGKDRVELYHDRLRSALLANIDRDDAEAIHVRLGRALLLLDRGGLGPWTFDVVRHLRAARARLGRAGRADLARLSLAAGRLARQSAAFRVALEHFLSGIEQLDASAWSEQAALANRLHSSAAEAAYLCSRFDVVEHHVEQVLAHTEDVLEQLVAREVAIDAAIAHTDYSGAVRLGFETLDRLGVPLPATPGEAEIGEALGRAGAALGKVGPEGFVQLADASEPRAVAAMRVLSRLSSAVYFANPSLFPIVASELVVCSVERGLAPASPYGLAIYGIVMNILGQHAVAHTWGQVALALGDRFEDRALVPRTGHVVHNLVRPFVDPLPDTLDDLRAVVEPATEVGDPEYAAYAAHAYVHNALYAGRPLAPLLAEALELGDMMRGLGEANALHVHAPFEQALRCLLGRNDPRDRLDGHGFEEQAALEAAEVAGNRSAQLIIRLVMGIVRYHLGDPADASAILEEGRPFLDGVGSTWHVPMFHQYAALSALAGADAPSDGLRATVDADLDVLRGLTEVGPANFAHRVALVEGERLRVEGRPEASRDALERSLALIEASGHGWPMDRALAHELIARVSADGDASAAHRATAAEVWAGWGAAPIGRS